MNNADRIIEKSSKRKITRISRDEYLKIHQWIYSIKEWIVKENPNYDTIVQKARDEADIQVLPKQVLRKLFEYNKIEFYLFKEKKHKSKTSEIIRMLEKLNQDQKTISMEIAEMKQVLSDNINKRNNELNFLLEEVSKALPSNNS